MTRDPGIRAGLAQLAPLAAIAVGAVAGIFERRGLDARFVTVTLGALLALTLFRVTRPASPLRLRAIHAALALPAFAALAIPRSWLPVSYLTAITLYSGLEATVYATRSAARLGASSASGVLVGAMAALPSLFLWSAALLVLFNAQLLMTPARIAHSSPSRAAGERALTIDTDDGFRLGATYTPGDDGAPGVVLAHGVADGRTRLAPWASRLAGLGYHVVRFDFRAHGQSEGAVCSYGQREASDVHAAVRALRSIAGVDRDRVAVVGASMGGGSVLAAAPRLEVRALVLLAPASRYPALVHERLGWLGPIERPLLATSGRIARAMGQTPLTEWTPAHGLRQTDAPTLVVHGTADRTIPLALSEQLLEESARVELLRLDGVGHDELPAAVLADPEAWSHVRAFLERELSPFE